MTLLSGAMALLLCAAIACVLAMKRATVALAIGSAAMVVAGLMAVIAAALVLGGALPPDEAVVQWQLPLGAVRLSTDALSAWFILALGLLGPACAVYSWGYMRHEPRRRAVPTYAAALCVLMLSILLVFAAGDVVPFLLGWELMSLSAYVLVSFDDRDPQVRRAAWTYLVATHLGTALCVLPMFGMLVVRSGATSFAGFPLAAASAGPSLAALLFALGVLGFGTKAGLMPMHVWLPAAHPVAPSPVSALMSGIVIKCGIYGLLRLLTWLPVLPPACGAILLVAGAVSGIAGILYALAQRNLKRMLAYSSVENIGIIAIGIGVGLLGRSTGHPHVAFLGFAGAILHVLNHALFKGLLFLAAGSVLHATQTADIERLGGLARRMPAVSALFLLAALAICALPPLNGFISEWLIYASLFRQAWGGLSAITVAAVGGLTALALIGGLAAAAFARAFSAVFLGEPRDAAIHPHSTHPAMIAGMSLLAAGCAIVAATGWMGPTLARILHGPVILLSQADAVSPIVSFAIPWRALLPLAVLLLAIAALIALRRQRFAVPTIPACEPTVENARPTWGCGFPHPAARIQYTASSFGWTLVTSFWQVLRPARIVTRPSGYFPQPGELLTRTPDLAMSRLFEPLFSRIARDLQRLWPLQHGRVQLYLIYIAGTLLAVFAVELYRLPAAPQPVVPHVPAAARPAPVPTVPQVLVQGEHR